MMTRLTLLPCVTKLKTPSRPYPALDNLEFMTYNRNVLHLCTYDGLNSFNSTTSIMENIDGQKALIRFNNV